MTTPTVERKSRASAETVLKTLTALFGLIVAVLAFWTSQLSKEKQQAESRTVVVQQESTELKQQVDTLSQEIERLKRELAAAPPNSGTSKSPAAQQYSVTMQVGETLDLDNRRKTRVESNGTEVSRATVDDLLTNPRGYEFFPVSTDLNEANCREAVEGTNDGRDSFTWQELTTGLTICVVTSESRMAGVTVIKRSVTYEGSVELGVQVW
jgi:uncharacterized small protein (DUF1192 family)